MATDAAAFAERLIGAASRFPVGESRLLKLLHSGRAPRSMIRRIATETLTGAARFPGQLAALALVADDARARLHLLDNLFEESGVRIVAGRGLVTAVESCHVSWAARFARAAGLDAPAVAAASSAPAPDSDFDCALDAGDWLGGLTYVSALEFNTPRTFAPMLEGLRASGFREADLVFFTRHLVADDRHGRDSLALCATLAVERGEQAGALRYAERAAERWWQSHEGTRERSGRAPARAV